MVWIYNTNLWLIFLLIVIIVELALQLRRLNGKFESIKADKIEVKDKIEINENYKINENNFNHNKHKK